MSKKKKIFIVSIILLIVILSFLGGNAYARYMSQVVGQANAEVAKWSFKVNGNTDNMQTINLSSAYDNEFISKNKLAPGTTGSFDIVIDATGTEVGLDYLVIFENEQNKPANLKYIYDGIEYNSICDISNKIKGKINANDLEKTKTIKINWKWDYETGKEQAEISKNNLLDTKDGMNIQNFNFNIKVVSTQSKNV